jgi:2-polyprenyl-3-methyl-5-hydroxy-6-metoxy-1,4-benzoquinol methylase
MPLESPTSFRQAGLTVEAVEFWASNQPGFKFAKAKPGTREFFAEVEEQRYALEPHIPEMALFERWAGRDVLDVGCGIATDGVRFARAGATYVGYDATSTAVDVARHRFELEGLAGSFVQGSATELPFSAETFDLVWSHGVIHHFEDTAKAVEEFHRVLRPGGVALVMLYHRRSFNYAVTILGVRRLLAATLLLPGGTAAVAKLTHEDRAVLEGHRELLRAHGLRYLRDRRLFLSNNTDGPGNPLSKVYSEAEARDLFSRFADVTTESRHLNMRLYPGGRSLEASRLGETLGRRVGWHLYVRAVK